MTIEESRSLDATFRSRLETGALSFQTCSQAHAVFPPRPVCPTCGSTELTWGESEGHGTIYSATTISPRGVDPYTVVVVDIDEGFRMMSRLDGEDALNAKIGDRVVTDIRPAAADGEPLPFVRLEATR
ncbi:OB-fold domain-containing protein [Aeromicrobium sp. zg-636]|uniref:OB-fold domain-containing protein n=1 Tax=Aeromicrobium senzhongii TaxID=2663859 RepID=A0A8I0EY25_9ACTN|nr:MULTISPECIES: OB-fold domain-containing protein [Aeromicrobium]MBC9227621.1 OB-fold domain-containing protein [Aeromicrobium senzhongii]